MRNGGGSMSKFFLCCGPIEVSDPHSVDCFISVANSKMDSPLNRKPSFRRSFSGAFKKLRETKRRKLLRQHSSGSSASSSDDSVRSNTSTINDEIESETLLSPCSSSVSANSTELVQDLKTERGKLRKSRVISLNYYVMCLLIVSLLVTVLWGKLVAVVMTTIWVYVVRVYLLEGRRRIEGLKNRLCRLWERREKMRRREGFWVRLYWCYVAACKTHNMVRK